MAQVYFAADGDDVGHHLEHLILKNKVNEITQFSIKFHAAMSWLEHELKELFETKIIFSGGDNVLALITHSREILPEIDVIRVKFQRKAGSTISIGLGKTPREAYFALKLSKTSGKNCIHQFNELERFT